MTIVIPALKVAPSCETLISVTPCDCTNFVTVDHQGYLDTAPWSIKAESSDTLDRDEAFRDYLFSLWVKYPRSYIKLQWRRDLSKTLLREHPWMKRLKEEIDGIGSLVDTCLDYDVSLPFICNIIDRSPFGRYPDDWEGDGVPPTESIVFLIDDAIAASEAIRFARLECEPTLLVA